ncbi:unnamed protein product [Trichobilharzia regenti]|nr:unnamed protein product [Trichobilharzia regenti]
MGSYAIRSDWKLEPMYPMCLVKHGANVNNRTEDGWTPLHSAAFWNQLASVQLLLEAGADQNARMFFICECDFPCLNIICIRSFGCLCN